tara:strand:- start:46648 stop:47148 length:501 start_codon:yes stop_codon:yes gene_type:complete
MAKEKPIPHLLVDGYNIIHAWPRLKKVFAFGSEPARAQLGNLLRTIHDTDTLRLTIVFDGQGKKVEIERPYEDLSFSYLFTSSDLTADELIEQLVQKSKHPETITVATKDNLLADTIRALGAFPITPDALEDWITRCEKQQTSSLDQHKRSTNKDWNASSPWRDLR